MNKQFALVTARSTSSRLPNKCFQLVAESATMVEAVIRRAKKMKCTVILCTTEDPSDDQLEQVADREKISCFRGALRNKIHRWTSCFQAFDAHSALLVDGDDPTFDFNVGQRALDMLLNTDVEIVKAAANMTPGFFTYGISKIGIEKLAKIVPDKNTDTDVITRYLEAANLKTGFIDALPNESTGHSLRLTVDYQEDIDFYRALHSKISYLAPSPEIVSVALANNFSGINWFRQAEFLQNQKSFNERVQLD